MKHKNHCGKALRKVRLEQGVSLRELAKRIGVTAGYLCSVEKERCSPPSNRRLHEIAKALDISIDSLMAACSRVPNDIYRLVEQNPHLWNVIRQQAAKSRKQEHK